MSRISPRVSVGLPVYNGEKYLAEAIQSILNQSLGDFELIISDNASEDATAEICQQYASQDGRIRYVRQRQNIGAARNFNYVFELAEGEYFKWAAHDDLHGPEFLGICADALDRDASAVLCFPRAAVVDERGRRVIEPDDFKATGRDDESLTDNAIQGRQAALESTFPHRRYQGVLLLSTRCYEVFGMVRAAAMRKTRLHGTYLGGEKVFLAEMSLRGPFRLLSDVQFFSRWHTDRFSAVSTDDQNEHMVAAKRGLPRQFRCTWEYLRAIFKADISRFERARCVAVHFRYLFQVHKWKRILFDLRSGGDTRLVLPAHARRLPSVAGEAMHSRSISQRLETVRVGAGAEDETVA